MELKKVKQSELTGGLAQVAGGVVGIMLPNVVANAIAKVEEGAVATDDQKKTKMFVNLGSTILGGYGTLAVQGKDLASALVKALALGVAVGGAKGLATHFLEDSVKEMPAGTAKSMLASGLGCACTDNTYPALQMPSYAMPSYDMARPRELSASFDLANMGSSFDLANM